MNNLSKAILALVVLMWVLVIGIALCETPNQEIKPEYEIELIDQNNVKIRSSTLIVHLKKPEKVVEVATLPNTRE